MRDHHQRNTIGNRFRVLKTLFRTNLESGGSMQERLRKMSEAIAKLHEMGTPVDDGVAVCAIR